MKNIKITADKRYLEHIQQAIYNAQALRLKPIGIVLGATELLKLMAELHFVQRQIDFTRDGYPLELFGLKLRLISDPIISLEYELSDAGRLSFGDDEEKFEDQ